MQSKKVLKCMHLPCLLIIMSEPALGMDEVGPCPELRAVSLGE